MHELEKIVQETLGQLPEVPICVGVSGGADSMALAIAAARVYPDRVTAITVDHGLRPESMDEAEQVHDWLLGRGIPHEIRQINWPKGPPKTGIQEKARMMRRGTLMDWCFENGNAHLLLAHHMYDQAETVLMRLGKGSGVQGLGGMRPIMMDMQFQFYILRPFLGVKPEALRAYLQEINQPWIEDPSNYDVSFQRVRVRNLLPQLIDAGIEPEGVVLSARRIQEASEFLAEAIDTAMKDVLLHATEDALHLDREPFRTLRPIIARQVISNVINHFDRHDYPLKEAKIAAVVNWLRLPHGRDKKTCGNCLFTPRRTKEQEWIMVTLEDRG